MAAKRKKSQVNTRAMQRRQQNRNNRLLISVMVLVMALILFGQMYSLRLKDQQYQEKMAQLQQQLSDEKVVTTQLEQQEEYVNSDKYIEDTAKAKLGMIHSDEIVFKEK